MTRIYIQEPFIVVIEELECMSYVSELGHPIYVFYDSVWLTFKSKSDLPKP